MRGLRGPAVKLTGQLKRAAGPENNLADGMAKRRARQMRSRWIEKEERGERREKVRARAQLGAKQQLMSTGCTAIYKSLNATYLKWDREYNNRVSWRGAVSS